MLAVAVGPALTNVEVCTSERVEVALTMDVGNGKVDGLPFVSSEVCTEPVVFVCVTEMVADCTSDVESDVRETSGTLVIVFVKVVVELIVRVDVMVSVLVVSPSLLDVSVASPEAVAGWLSEATDELLDATEDVLEADVSWLLTDVLELLVVEVSDDELLVVVASDEVLDDCWTLVVEVLLGTSEALATLAEDAVVEDSVDVAEKDVWLDGSKVNVVELSKVTRLVHVVVLKSVSVSLTDENVSVCTCAWTCPSEICCTVYVGCHGAVPVLVYRLVGIDVV